MDIRYSLDGDRNDEAMELLRINLEELGDMPGMSRNDLVMSIEPPHKEDDVITIRLENAEKIQKDRIIDDKEYIVALKPELADTGTVIPNYTAASVMGLSLAALRNASDSVKDHKMDKKDYDELRKNILSKFREIYYRYDIISSPDSFSEEELEMMVSGASPTKLYYTLYYALPPAVKVTGNIHEYHEILQDTLVAA